MPAYSQVALNSSDVKFLVLAVMEAEQVPGMRHTCTYERVFAMTREECEQFLLEALSRETTGNQLDFRSFHAIACEGRPVACCSAWIEGADGQPSGLKVAILLSRFLGTKRWRERSTAVSLIARCSPKRTVGALQLETFFVDPAHRGKGLTRHMIDLAIAAQSSNLDIPGKAEISLFSENSHAAAAYARAGFTVAWASTSDATALESLTGSKGFVQLSRALPGGGTLALR